MRKIAYEFDAIGTHWWCEVLGETGEFTPEIINGIDEICAVFDRRYSRFRDDSLVMELFRTGKLSNPPQEMVEMFGFAHELYQATDGVFDISVGATLHSLGYGRREHGGVAPGDIWNHIRYAPDEIRAPQGIMLDFGGQGKGWLIDSISGYLRQNGIDQFIVNGGGDLYASSSLPVLIALEDPLAPDKKFGQTSLMNEALAASSTYKRSWQIDGAMHHHIIDPATSSSAASGVVGTFVKAPTAKLADSLATVLIVRPDLTDSLKRQFGIETIIVR